MSVVDVRRYRYCVCTLRQRVRPDLRWYAEGHREWRDDHVVGHDRTGAHQRTFSDDGAVKDDGARPHQRVVLDRAALEMGDVTDDTVRPDSGGSVRCGVHHCSVLNRSSRADEYLSVVTSQYGAGPHRGFRFDVHIADDHGIRMHERGRIDHRHPVTERVDGHVSAPLPPTSMGAHRGRSGVLQVHAGTVRGAVTQNSPQKVGTTRDLAVLHGRWT